ncbi:molecular chaperone [Pseudomonas sp. LJDD11]|uniref:fimbrial biogenesis chaperone n=2 Tax=unclassified Pseudomonas TaxID=196821 RepID=UPI00359C7E4B
MSLSFMARARPALLAGALLLGQLPASHAALTVSGTRVVFPGDKNSVSLIVSNPSEQTFAVQTWVNTAADDTTTAVPFMITPPLFRLDPGQDQQLILNKLPHELPTDRESLFYFNVQEIPQAHDTGTQNLLNIALRTRLKLFYRPAGLKGGPTGRLKELQWSVQQVGGQTRLQVDNPSPFHVSFTRMDISGNGHKQRLNSPPMVAPMSQQSYPLPGIKAASGLQVTFAAINDYGGVSDDHTAALQFRP